MPRAARFPEDTRHFMVRNVGISPLPNSVKIDEIECHAILCERNLAQKLALRASQADHGQVIWEKRARFWFLHTPGEASLGHRA